MKRVVLLLVLVLTSQVSATTKSVIRWPVEHVDLTVAFNLQQHSLDGIARLTLPDKGAKTLGFLLNKNFELTGVFAGGEKERPIRRGAFLPGEISPDYGKFGQWDSAAATLWTFEPSKTALKQKPVVIEIHYRGTLYVPPNDRQFSRETIAQEVAGTIGKEGIFLSSGAFWFPTIPDCTPTHSITAHLPEGWSCVTNGVPSKSVSSDGGVEIVYQSDRPTGGLSFSAGQYQVKTVQEGDVVIATYFLPGEASLADGYLEACRKYIKMYSHLIAPYPFPRFTVVDNFLPSGYGMPGWTLIGDEVLRLPFIKDISLGHEVLHNWFGNSLLVDYRQGNWCEGLTTYLADYKYKADADSSAAVEYRMSLLRDYAAYLTTDNEYPVSQFSERSDQADRAIGYGKVMMVFHMLRQMLEGVAPGMFEQVIAETYKQYQWQPIGWDVWQREFERRLGQKLDWFFAEWVQQPGAPKISLENVKPAKSRNGWDVGFEVATTPGSNAPYRYLLNIRAVTDRGFADYQTFIQNPRQSVSLGGSGELEGLVLDPGFNIFRVIYPGEAPVTLANFIGDPDGMLVTPGKGTNSEVWRKAAEGLKGKGQQIIADKDYQPNYNQRSLWILGGPDENSIWTQFPTDTSRLALLPGRAARWKEEQPMPPGIILAGETFRGGALTATVVGYNPYATGKFIAYTVSLPDADPIAGTRKLSHYGKYSYLLFDGDTNIRKGVWGVSGDSPMTWRLK